MFNLVPHRYMNTKLLLTFLTLWTVIFCINGENIIENKVKLDMYGFVRNDIYIDTYKGYGGAKEEYYLIPKYIGQDKLGRDINQSLNANMMSITSRFGFKLTGPEVFNAETTARIETDFLGLQGALPTLLRIRLAYMEFKWEKATLLAGQDWHPFFTLNCFAKTVGINTGAPFNPFSRTPQLKFNYKTGKILFTAATLYELQFATIGPLGATSEYQRNAAIPELIGGVEFTNNGIRVGGMVAVKTVKPRLLTDSMYVTDQLLTGLNYMGYAQYTRNKLEINAKAVYGGLMTHMVMPGGFGVSAYDITTGQETYTPINYLTSYFNILYGKKLRVGGYLAYGKKVGNQDALYDFSGVDESPTRQWGRFLGVNTMYRASASLVYNIKNVVLMAEFETTIANYGQGDMDLSNGIYPDVHRTINHRLNLGIMYTF